MVKPDNADCIQKHTGSCLGCNVHDMIRTAVTKKGEAPEKAAQRIGKELCPSDATPQTHNVTNGESHWGATTYKW